MNPQYEKVKGFLEKLFVNSKYSNEGIADEALESAITIAEYGNTIKNVLYRIAENRQRVVLGRRAKIFDDLYKRVVEVGKNQDFEEYDSALAVLMKEGRGMQQSASRMKNIDNMRGLLTNGKH